MTDRDLRNAALFAVRRLWRRHGDAVPWNSISDGFRHGGERIPFLSPFEGVFKPRQLRRGALSVRSTIASRYDDERVADDRAWYDYSPLPGRNDWLKESPLLDGAHLVPDREELGAPRVRNGLSLCALHHRAFDRDLLGITPELTVHVFRERLEAPEEEPTRIVTRLDGEELRVPDREEARPDPELVAHWWETAREG